MKRAAFFGRFQPPHRGHMEVVREILEEYDEVVFMVGMSSESHTERNPFTAGERVEMLRLSCRDCGFDLSRVATVTVPTLEFHISSAFAVLSYAPRVEAVYLGNRAVARMLEEIGVKAVIPKPYQREKYSGALIRELMKRGDPSWKELVTPSVADFIEKIGGVERVRSVALQQGERHVLGRRRT